jgi:hypothetical protein
MVPKMTIICQPIRVLDWLLRWLQSGCNETIAVCYISPANLNSLISANTPHPISAADVTREDNVPNSGDEWHFAVQVSVVAMLFVLVKSRFRYGVFIQLGLKLSGATGCMSEPRPR